MTTAVVILSVVVIAEYLIASGKISELVQDNALLRAKNYDLEHKEEQVTINAGKLKSQAQSISKAIDKITSLNGQGNNANPGHVTSKDR